MAYIEVMEVTGSLSRRVLPFIFCACISYLSKMSHEFSLIHYFVLLLIVAT